MKYYIILYFLLLVCSCDVKKETQLKSNLIEITSKEQQFFYQNPSKKNKWIALNKKILGKFKLECLKQKGYDFVNVFLYSDTNVHINIYNPYAHADVNQEKQELILENFKTLNDTLKFCEQSNQIWIFYQKKWVPLKLGLNDQIGFDEMIIQEMYYQKINTDYFLLVIGNTLKGQGSTAKIREVFVVNLDKAHQQNVWYKRFTHFDTSMIGDFSGKGKLQILKFVYEDLESY